MQTTKRGKPRLSAIVSYPLVRVDDWTSRLFEAESPRAYRICFAVLLAGLLTTCTLIVTAGCAHQLANPWDTSGILDAGWRVYLGQAPHRDFFSHLGVAYLGLLALAMWIGGPTASAMAYAGAMPVLPLGLLSWWVSRRRFSAVPALVLSAMIGVLPAGTSQLGTGCNYRTPSYAMQYNRIGWAILCIILVQLLFPARRKEQENQESAFEYWVSGVLIGILLFIKVNYALVAIGMIPIGLLLATRGKSRGALVVGIALGIALVASLLPVDVPAMIDDQQNIAAVQKLERRINELKEITYNNMPALLAVVGLAVFSLGPVLRAESVHKTTSPFQWLSLAIAVAVPLVAGLAICSTNYQWTMIPTFALSAIFLLEWFRRRRKAALGEAPLPSDDRVRWLLGVWIFLLLTVPIVAGDAKGISYCFLWKWLKAQNAPETAKVATPSVADMLYPPQAIDYKTREQILDKLHSRGEYGPQMTPYDYAFWLADGTKLLQQWTDAKSRVFTMDFLNPFPFILKLPTPRGTPLCFHRKRLVNDYHFPAPERVFQEATHVMVPKSGLVVDSTQWVDRHYGPYLREHYAQVATSELWILYVRNDLVASQVQAAAQRAAVR